MKVEREEGGRRTAGGLNSGLKYQSASEEEQRGRAVVRGESTRAGQERDGYERKTEREKDGSGGNAEPIEIAKSFKSTALIAPEEKNPQTGQPRSVISGETESTEMKIHYAE
ncbi:hypothetical protein G5I_13418 [Acromyrmex echinatior]|uniref:Uncharacterized protein n=1 Tax=Acromyrmex echinatior TaxID=103372 RepID=F4X4Z5_ACREC|nr:hypothetical protein G5I_13418 [Acromyrmex echinatior]